METFVLVGCEESQAVTIELRQKGINAFSCDLKPCSGGHPDGIRYLLGIYEDNPITQIRSYDRIGDARVKVSLETLFETMAGGVRYKFPIEVPLPKLDEVDRILKNTTNECDINQTR